jgi:transposase
MSLSQDLRRRIVDLVATGVSRRAAARHFQISASSAIRFVKQAKEVGHVEVKPREPRRSRLDPFGDDIISWMADQPDLTLQELSGCLAQAHGVTVATSTLDDWLRANKITYKKNGTRH